MKLMDRLRQRQTDEVFYTFEFFPPKTQQGLENLLARISRLADLNPLAVSVTWGAGGSTRDRSLMLAGTSQEEYGIDTIMHLTCTNMEKETLNAVLQDAYDRGIDTILALRGDPPRGEEYWIPSDPRFTHAVDLVSYIKSIPKYAAHFCIGVAGYPDGHPDERLPSDEEIGHLKRKVDAGAEFIITQLFYDVDKFIDWQAQVRQAGIAVPIIPGIMPMQSFVSFTRLAKLCGTKVPASMLASLEPLRHDDQKIKDYGVTVAVNMIRRILRETDIHVFHFCTLNLEKSVRRILEELNLVPSYFEHVYGTEETPVKLSPGRQSQDLPQADLLMPPHDATKNLKPQILHTNAGSGEINNASSWDEFPNGRFGDFKSPAYGVQDLWNANALGALGVPRQTAISFWGYPRSLDDLTQMFLSHLDSKITSTPFSPTVLSDESLLILTHLQELNKRSWWTVGSQPAVDSVDSADKTVGWGPKGGFVFQKSFVEFFAEKQDVIGIQRAVEHNGKSVITFYAGNSSGDYISNVFGNVRNAVTWGVFPGQEIVQSTILERESFLAWKDEAYNIWSEWALLFAPTSEERQLLDAVRRDRWLISVIHHDFKQPMALWEFLASC